MSEVLRLSIATKEETQTAQAVTLLEGVLTDAKAGEFVEVLLVVRTRRGDDLFSASGGLSRSEQVGLLERAKFQMLHADAERA